MRESAYSRLNASDTHVVDVRGWSAAKRDASSIRERSKRISFPFLAIFSINMYCLSKLFDSKRFYFNLRQDMDSRGSVITQEFKLIIPSVTVT